MTRYSKRSIFVAGCMGMLLFGIVIATLGSVLPSVMEKFSMDKADAGSLFVMMNLGMLTGSILFGPLVDRYGYKWVLAISAMIVFLSLEGIAFAPSLMILKFSLFFVGFSGGAVNGGTNALISDISEENRGSGLSLLGVFFGIGALGVPLLLGTLLDRFTYEGLIGFIGIIILIPVIFFTILKFPAPKHEKGFPIKDGIMLVREPVLILFGLILFIQSGLEMTVSGWSATFMHEELNLPARQSVLYLSFYWLGLIAARAVISELLKKFSMTMVMNLSMVISIAASSILILSNGVIMVIPALFMTGVGFAAIFPLVFAYVGNLYSNYSGTAFSVILAIALLGGMLIPWITGLLTGILSLRLSLIIVPLSMMITILIFRSITRFKSN